MKVGCEPYEGTLQNIRKSTNDLWMEKSHANATYVASSTKELIPVYMITDALSGDSFKIHKGLILYHFTVHDPDIEFSHPNPGSFFATTPSHSLFIAYEEKRHIILKGDNVLPSYNNPEDEEADDRKYEEALVKYGVTNDIDPEEREEIIERLGNMVVPMKGRLITYRLKRDIQVIDSPGDSIQCDDFLRQYPNVDGVIGGYTEGSGYRSARENLNEIRICAGPLEDYLDYIEEIDITPEMVKEHLTRHSFESDFTSNKSIKVSLQLPADLFTWRCVSTELGLMHLNILLEEEVDASLRLLMFLAGNVYVSVEQTAVTAVIMTFPWKNASIVAKCWYRDDNPMFVWPLLKTFMETYAQLKTVALSLNEASDINSFSSLILDDSLITALRKSGAPVDDFLK